MRLDSEFDVVLMLTWSNWDKEPRSNRFHYASRFAKELPTFFLQHNYSKRDGINIHTSDIPNLEILDLSVEMTVSDINEIKKLLRNRGFLKPLLWIYDSLNYGDLISAFPNSYHVYHATEDYFTPTKGWNRSMSSVRDPTQIFVKKMDYVVYVADALEKVYKEICGYMGDGSVIKNGCDAEYFIEIAESFHKSENLRPSAIFQGSINNRIDYNLLIPLIQSMPDWDFKFCGVAQPSEGWKKILGLPNVQYLGVLEPEEFGRHICDSTVGIIPYIQDSWIKNSFPLKAYEYVACGLPVVTVPITELEIEPELFAFAKTPVEFETKIRLLQNTRHEVSLARKRRQTALENSYNKNFELFKEKLINSYKKKRKYSLQKKARIAILYDSVDSLHVSTIKEHLESFERYSKHDITYIPASSKYWIKLSNSNLNFNGFDVVILHYSIRLSIKNHLDKKISNALRLYNGLKLLFIQDEYEGTEIARTWIDEIYFDFVYTCVPMESIEKVYPQYRFPGTRFIQVLTGYASDNIEIEQYSKPLKDRTIDIAYRGRNLPPIYGSLGNEKYRIGVDVKKFSTSYGLKVDIETDVTKRIYGNAWYEFIGSARSTLGTESGSNIFDTDGSISSAIKVIKKNNPLISYEQIYQEILINHEGSINMNQISPKLFEAMQLRTALILFEGDYSGIIYPDLHYISLKKDYSNINEVFEKLRDDSLIEKMTLRAYEDVISSELYSYRSFIRKVDDNISNSLLHYVDKSEIFSIQIKVNTKGGVDRQIPLLPVGISCDPYPKNMPVIKTSKGITILFKYSNPLMLLLQFLIKVAVSSRARKSFIFPLGKSVFAYLPHSLQNKIINIIISR